MQFLAGKENMFFLKFLSHGILRDINERDVFLNCKHKHMLKKGAPLDNRTVTHKIPWF